MRRVIIFLLSCFMIAKATGQIVGTIVSLENKELINNATVELRYATETKFAISDSSGKFSFDSVSLKTIIVSHLKFKILNVNTDQAKALNFIFLMHSDTVTLDNVSVTSNRTLVRVSVSKISYDIAKDSSQKNKTAAEAISRLPFLSLNIGNELVYKNNRSFAVLVNGSRFGLFSDNPNVVLKSIPSSMIESVDLVFDPPLEYKLKGYDAVINIHTKPGYYKGVLGSLSGYVNTIGQNRLDPFISFQHNQTYLQLSYKENNNNYSKSFQTDIRSKISNSTLIERSDLDSKTDSKQLDLTIDQRLNTQSRVGFFASVSRNFFKELGTSFVTIIENGQEDAQQISNSLKDVRRYYDLGGDFSKSYSKNKGSFNFLVKYSHELSELYSTSSIDFSQRSSFRQIPNEFSAQVGNTLNLKDGISWETFTNYKIRQAGSYIGTDTLLNQNWSHATSNEQNHFRFDLFAFSNLLSIEKKSVSFRLGMTLDKSVYVAKNDSSRYSKNALNVLPLGSIRLLLKKNQFVDLKFKTALYRPTFRTLASSIPVFDPLIAVVGNPRLGTNLYYTLSSEYSKYFGKRDNYLYGVIEFEFSNNYFNSFSSFDSTKNQKLVSYRESNYRSIFWTIGSDISVSDKLSSGGNISIGFTNIGDNFSAYPVLDLYQSVTYRINPSSGIQVIANYQSKNISSTGYKTQKPSYELNIYKFLLKRTLQLNVLVSNVFKKTQRQTEISETDDIFVRSRILTPYRAFRLTASYRFGQLKTFQSKSKKLGNSDQRSIN